MNECKPLDCGDARSEPRQHVEARARGTRQGEAVKVEPMKPKLKPPGTRRWKLQYDGLL